MNDPNYQFPQVVRDQNPQYMVIGPRNSRHYVNPGTHNVSNMINMTHGLIQMTPAHITQRQQAVYLPGNVAYLGSSNHPAAAHYPFNPQQASQAAVLLPYVNYPTNQQGIFFTPLTRPLQMTNLPQRSQNPPVANMSNARNSHGKSLIVQSQPKEMAPITQPMQQVPRQPLTTPMQLPEAARPVRKKTIIKIIDPKTGHEVDLNNSLQGPPTADELEKMKVQSQFQSQVLNAVIKNDIKSSDNNPNNKGEDKVKNPTQSQVKKLPSESVSEPSKVIEIDIQVSEEVISEVKEISVVSTNIKKDPVTIIESTSIDVGLTVNAEENSSDVKECEVETPINIVPSSNISSEVQIQNADVINISKDIIFSKKNLDEESIKSGIFFTPLTRPLQMTNLPQRSQNPPVANMSNARNSHGKSLIVQSQPKEMAPITQPMQQVPRQPLTTPMQLPEAARPVRKKTIIKIIDPKTGHEVDLNNSLQGPPTADELEKMKVQSQFQSQVLNAVIKNDIKSSDNNPNNKGEDKVKNPTQSQVKKLPSESVSEPSKVIEIDIQVSEEVISEVKEISVVSTNIKKDPVTIIESTSIDVGLTVNAEENSSDVKECEVETPINIVPSSNISSDLDEESIKSVKSKIKKNNNQQKTLVKLYANDGINIENSIEPAAIKPVIEPKTNIIKQQENKENENNNHNSKNEEEENVILKPEESQQQPEEIQNNGVKHEPVKNATPKLPSYLEKLPYAEGQWSITNPTGKKVYSKVFLLQLGSEAVCQKKPDVLNNWSNLIMLSVAQQFNSLGGMAPNLPRSQSASATGLRSSHFKPGNSQRGSSMPIMQSGAKQNSSQGKTAIKTAKPNTIHMSLSLREEVKLNQTENAWVPTAAKNAMKSEVSKTKNEEEQKNDEVNKNVRSILNKITPNNMPPLTERFKALPIDTIQRLERTIDLVFEKAIEEQSFAPLYASLCSAMQSVQVNSKDGKTASFKKLIISKCQSLFELDKAQEMDSAKKLTEINSCKDPKKKKELQLEFEENERRLRKRSVGNCRFIGELFKQKILTPNIMLYCIMNLVTKHVEEPLECLCNLLKTVGKELEQSHNLNNIFDKLKALTSRDMKSKIPSRIKFMIQDVIDLRRDKWIPRLTDSKPKLINEIENDVKNEAIEQQYILLGCNRPEKRDHHCGDDKFRGGENKIRRENENEWNVKQTNTKYKQQNYTIDQNKLSGLKDNTSMTIYLAPQNRSFSTGKNMTFTSSNPYAVLNNDEKLSTSSQIMSNKNTSRKSVISESEERPRMMSDVASMMPQLAQPSPSINSSSSQPKEPAEEPTSELDDTIPDKINIKCKNILLEYEQLQNLDDIIYSLSEDQSSVIRTRHEKFVKSMLLITLDNSPTTRTNVAGKIFAELLSKKILSMEAITQGIDAVLKDWNDYLMDYPQFFSYIAAIIAPLLLSQNASFDFNNLKDSCTSIRPNNSSEFFIEVLNKILSSKEIQNTKEQLGGILWIYNKWRTSEYVPLDEFMPNNQINKFFKNDRIGVFLLSIAMYDKIKLTDSKLLYDTLHSWISVNISAEIIKCPQFVRALTIAIVIVCSKPNYSYEDFFDHVHVNLLTCYIRSQPLPEPEIQAREVQCLYGIQIMSAVLEHPEEMVLRLFHKLYQDSVISKDSFELWKKEDELKSGFAEDLETKTMAVVVLNSFFLKLAVNDSDKDETVE